MTLTHFSDACVIVPYSENQIDEPDMKPAGLWVSVDGPDDWPTFCNETDGAVRLGAIAHEITLCEKGNVLTLKSVADIFAFTVCFGSAPVWSESRNMIRWDKVAQNFQGIIITPYQWDCRLDPRTWWYYTWDCASGCIWDHTAIQSVTRRTEAA